MQRVVRARRMGLRAGRAGLRLRESRTTRTGKAGRIADQSSESQGRRRITLVRELHALFQGAGLKIVTGGIIADGN